MTSLLRIGLISLAFVIAALLATPASAQLRRMSDNDMSSTYAQGLLDISNSSFTNIDNTLLYSTRIAIGADVKLSANIKNIVLGNYVRPGYALPSDIDMPLMQFGRSDAGDAARLVQITNPYFEFIYRNVDTAAKREVIGMRLGFEGISGEIGMLLDTLSGSTYLKRPPLAGGVEDPRGPIETTGIRVANPKVGSITAGDANGPSRDFWVAALKIPVQFPAPPGAAQAPTAQSGFWFNWRDRLVATAGAPPPNMPLRR